MILYAVVELRRGGRHVVARNAQRDLMVYTTARSARTACKLHGRRGDVEAIRIIPFSCEGELIEDAWEENEHMQVWP